MKAWRRWRILKSPFHKTFPPASEIIAGQIDKRIVVDRVRKFIYFRIPKAANSTVMSTLIDGSATSREAKRALPRASTLSSDDIGALSERFFLFTVVRNPYARLASAYLDKVARGNWAEKIRAKLGADSPDDITFLEFCRYLESDGIFDNPHWYRQCDFVSFGPEQLHFVGRVETLKSDLEKILKRVNRSESVTQRNWAPHATGATSKLGELYCEESVRIVRDLYAADFSAFGYSDEPEWV